MNRTQYLNCAVFDLSGMCVIAFLSHVFFTLSSKVKKQICSKMSKNIPNFNLGIGSS